MTLGTTPSAPRGPHMLKVVIRTTVVSLLIFGVFYIVTKVLGYSFDDIPRIVPSSTEGAYGATADEASP